MMDVADTARQSEMETLTMNRTRLGVTVATLAVCLTVSCSTSPTVTDSTTVSDNGFSAFHGALSISGGPGVAPPGTIVNVRPGMQPAFPEAGEMLIPLSEAFDITLNGGTVQPASPVRAIFAVDRDQVQKLLDRGVQLAVVSELNDEAEYIPAVLDRESSTVVAELPHFSSWGLFGFDSQRLVDDVVLTLESVLGTRFPKPDCVGKTADYAVTRYGVSPITDDIAWSCIRHIPAGPQEGRLGIDLYSNTPYIWKVDATPDPVDTRANEIDLDNYAPSALYAQMIGRSSGEETFLLPGGSVSMDFGQYELSPERGTLAYDVGVYTVGLLGYGVSVALSKLKVGSYQKLLDNAEAIDCLTSLRRGYADLSVNVNPATIGRMIQEVLSCVGRMGGDVLKKAIAFVAGGLAGAVTGPILSFLSPRLRTQSASFEVITYKESRSGAEAQSSPPADGVGSDPEECGTVTIPMTGKTATVLNANNIIDCSEAVSVMNRYNNDPTLNDRIHTFDDWTCSIFGAAEAEELGYVVKCEREDSATIMLAAG